MLKSNHNLIFIDKPNRNQSLFMSGLEKKLLKGDEKYGTNCFFYKKYIRIIFFIFFEIIFILTYWNNIETLKILI